MIRATTGRPIAGNYAFNRDSPQAQGLRAWYPLNGLYVDAPDLSGHGHRLTHYGPSLAVDKKMGRVSYFTSGDSEYFGSNDPPVISLPITFVCWVQNVGTISSRGIYRIYSAGSSECRIEWRNVDSQLRVRVYFGGTTGSNLLWSIDLANNTWYLIFGFFWESTNWGLQVNDADAQWKTFDVGAVSGLNAAQMGVVGSSYYNGPFADLKVYDEMLSADERLSFWEPRTRWDTYLELGRRTYFFLGALAPRRVQPVRKDFHPAFLQ